MKGRKMLICGIIVLVTATFSNAANILAIIPMPSFSHQVAYQQLWKELSLRGHKVTTVTTDPLEDSALTNLTEINMSYMYEAVEKKFNRVELIHAVKDDPLLTIKVMRTVQEYILYEELSHPSLQELIKNENNHKFDVVLAEFLFPPMFAFAEVYNCPLIVLSSMDVTSSIYHLMGSPIHSVTHPDMLLLPMIPPLNFKERLMSTISSVILSTYIRYVVNPRDDLAVRKFFGNEVSSVSELRKSISLLFLNVDPIFYPVKLLPPSIILVGGGSHIKSTKPIPEDLEHFMANSTEGVIYFSLGSNVRSENLGAETLKSIFEALEELSYKVVWKFDSTYAYKQSEKLYMSKWLPQQAILENPKIKLFITQGGCQSLDEAIYNHVPILGLPFIGEQSANVQRMVSKGIGLSLDYKTMTKSSFKNAIIELMNNPKYRDRVRELAELARDQPMTGLERAVWWTEYVIRHKGAKHLRSPFLDLPSYQYYHLDVIVFCLTVIFVLMYIIVKILQTLLNCVKRVPKTKQKVQ